MNSGAWWGRLENDGAVVVRPPTQSFGSSSVEHLGRRQITNIFGWDLPVPVHWRSVGFSFGAFMVVGVLAASLLGSGWAPLAGMVALVAAITGFVLSERAYLNEDLAEGEKWWDKANPKGRVVPVGVYETPQWGSLVSLANRVGRNAPLHRLLWDSAAVPLAPDGTVTPEGLKVLSENVAVAHRLFE